MSGELKCCPWCKSEPETPTRWKCGTTYLTRRNSFPGYNRSVKCIERCSMRKQRERDTLQDQLDALLVIRPMETAPRDGTWIMLWSRYCDKDYVNEEPIEELPEVVAWQGEKPIWMTVRGERYEEEYIRFVGWTPVPVPIRKDGGG